jgi:hypothetical protein
MSSRLPALDQLAEESVLSVADPGMAGSRSGLREPVSRRSGLAVVAQRAAVATERLLSLKPGQPIYWKGDIPGLLKPRR